MKKFPPSFSLLFPIPHPNPPLFPFTFPFPLSPFPFPLSPFPFPLSPFPFPLPSPLPPSSSFSSETFFFVLTDTSGTRNFGYCRRMLRPSGGGEGGKKEKRCPRALFLLSPESSFDIFHQVFFCWGDKGKR